MSRKIALIQEWKRILNTIPGYEVAAWISLIYVAPAYRKRGIGTQLLNIAEAAFTTCHKTTFYLGKDDYNFFPGLPVDLKSSAG